MANIKEKHLVRNKNTAIRLTTDQFNTAKRIAEELHETTVSRWIYEMIKRAIKREEGKLDGNN